MVSTILSIILGVVNAIPIVKSIVDMIVAGYVAAQYKSMKDDNKTSIRQAVSQNDQRPIETVIGSPTAGEPSGIPGSSIVDGLPK